MSLKNLESNQTNLINKIKKALNKLDEEKLYKILNIINPIDKDNKLTEKFKKLGLDSAKDGILRIIENEFSQKEREFILNNIILTNNDNKNNYKFSAKDFVNSNNIYDLINSRCKDTDNNPIFSLKTLETLAKFDKRSGTQAGKFEFICQLFMKNINEQNKGRNDINTKDGIEFEFKGFRGSIRSQETTHNPSVVYKEFKELLSNLLSDDTSKVQSKQSSLIRLNTNLDKQLDEIEKYNYDFYTDVVTNLGKYDFLKSKKIFNTYFNKLLTCGISDKTLNEILGKSLIKQIQLPTGYDRDIETEKIINFLNDNNSFESQKANANIFWENILVIHLYFYYGHHHWSYLTVFGVIKSSPVVYDGLYVCIGKEYFDPKANDVLNELKKKLNELKIFPTQGLDNDERKKAPTISLYSKNINR